MAHPYHMHREQQVAHRRVGPILKDEPDGAERHARSPAFSKVTSKTAAEGHDGKVVGGKAAQRFARGGKVKHKGQTNIAIVMPHHTAPAGPMAGPAGGAPPPMAGPGPLPGGPPGAPPGGPPGMPPGGPPGMPPGMPMRARGGKIDGEATKGDIKGWSKRAAKNSYFRGGAATGVGREEKAEHMKRKGK